MYWYLAVLHAIARPDHLDYILSGIGKERLRNTTSGDWYLLMTKSLKQFLDHFKSSLNHKISYQVLYIPARRWENTPGWIARWVGQVQTHVHFPMWPQKWYSHQEGSTLSSHSCILWWWPCIPAPQNWTKGNEPQISSRYATHNMHWMRT